MSQQHELPLTASRALFARAQQLIPGGVNSPVRAFRYVGGDPRFIDHGEGPFLVDADGNRFIDYVCSWGPLILGHADPDVAAAVIEAVHKGSSFGAPTRDEITLAEMVVDAVPSMEMVRMVSSGTEACMSAIRAARGFTGRNKILKFAGCYHGHSDCLLVQAGSGAATMGVPDSAGVTPGAAQDTLTARYNDLDQVRDIAAAQGDEIACIIVEPVAGNCGVICPLPGFLEGLREVCDQHGIVLCFDEVISGFRVAYGGAQERYGVTPDLTTLGKIIGGGFPVGAYGGRREILSKVAPLGPIYQAGTLSGNPVAMAAGIATLTKLRRDGVYDRLERLAARLADGLLKAVTDAGIPASGNRVGSMMSLFFTPQAVNDADAAETTNGELYGRYFRAMLNRGHYFAPSRLEAAFVSLAHTEELIDTTVAAAREVCVQLSL